MRTGGLVLGAVLAAATNAHADDALDKPAFTATADELLAAASKAPAGDWPVVILRADDTRSVDDQGRVTQTWRWVFVVRSQAGIDDWGTLSSDYLPFYQDKPAASIRVIDPKGAVAELDQTLITDAPAIETASHVFSDTRTLQAPIPRLQIGSVVEEQLVLTDREPLLAAGSVETLWLGAFSAPVVSTRIVISAPVARKAKVKAGLVPASAKLDHRKTGGREVWSYRIGSLDPLPDIEDMTGPDVHQRPFIGLATAASWAAVATDYNKLVEHQIADGAVTLPAGLPATASLETIDAIVRWLHKNIRYTGIEFADASNIPWTPSETVKRGFGDCKDKATLLVALLRQAKIPADLALVSTGPGLDVEPDLPGMGDFNHAIVRARVGKTDVWIDATVDLTRPGQLPEADQGRWALIVADGTKQLVTTPATVAKDNVIREVRTFDVAELGAAKVTEVGTETGTNEPSWRAWLRDTRADEVKQSLTSYVDDEYLGKLDSYRSTDAAALDKPLELTVIGTDTSRAFTGRGKIDVHLFPSSVLARVPRAVVAEGTRTHDLVWSLPHVYEIENRIVLPPGFTVPPLPAARTTKLGSASLTTTYRLDGKTTVIVTLRFDSGAVQIKAADVAAMRDAVVEARKEDVHLQFEHTGSALSDRGKPREALAEIQALIKLHPREAIHYTQLATVLRQAGMGEAARRAARKAVELEPKNADAYSVLGWVLRFDSLGREYGFDYDRAGAIAAYRKALALDPKHVGATSALAELLLHGTSGRRWDAGADLPGAEKLLRTALTLDDDSDTAAMLSGALLAQGKYEEAATFERTRPVSVDRDARLVAAISMAQGADAALAEAARLRTGTGQTAVIDKSVALLMVLRQYDAARALDPHGSPQQIATRAQLIARIQRVDKLAKLSKDPQAAIQHLMLALVAPARSDAKLFWDADARADLLASFAVPELLTMDSDLMPMGFWTDAMIAVSEHKVEGKAGGPWRAEAKLSTTATAKSGIYLALDHGIAKVVGTAESPRGLGRLASALLAKGNLDGARAVLDWLAADTPTADFTAIWGPNFDRDKTAIALAAAIVAGGSGDAASIDVLTKCTSSITAARSKCDVALAQVLQRLERWDTLLDHATAWREREPDDVLAVYSRGLALLRLGKNDDVDALADAFAAKHADAPLPHWMRMWASVARGQLDVAVKRFAPVTVGKPDNTFGMNEAAWIGLAAGGDLSAALDLAKRANSATKDRSPILNTLAAIHAELGELADARTEEWRAMEVDRRATPESEDYYVVGRIAEQLGLKDDAIAAYKKVKVKPDPGVPTAQDLADRRLKALGVTR